MDKPHVLIIEDDASVCELLLSCLGKAGYRVSIAQSGEAALMQIEEDPPEVVVLDLNLPGMNGLDVCRAMRRDPWMGQIPVLMLTGQSEEDDIVAGLEVGADDYMTKPFSIHELVARVKAHLRRSERERADVTEPAPGRLIHGKLSMDPERHEVLMDGEPVELSLKEFELLRVLMENRGRVLTRDRLLDEVWGYDYYGETRTVDVHIRHLRRKLNADGDSLIHTVRGVGYQIRQEAE